LTKEVHKYEEENQNSSGHKGKLKKKHHTIQKKKTQDHEHAETVKHSTNQRKIFQNQLLKLDLLSLKAVELKN